LVCNVNNVYGNLKAEKSKIIPAEISTKLYVHEFGFSIDYMYRYILDALFRGWYSCKNIKRNVLYPFPAERQQKLNIISGPVRGILLFTSPHKIVH
jgi:hypothetical protein